MLREQPGIETHLVVTRAGELTRRRSSTCRQGARALAVSYPGHLGASIAGGSFLTMGMVVPLLHSDAGGPRVCPRNLLTQAADVVSRSGDGWCCWCARRRSTGGHLKDMLAVTEAGGVVMPPVPAFYARPRSIDELVTDTVCRALDLFDLDVGRLKRWGEEHHARSAQDSGPAWGPTPPPQMPGWRGTAADEAVPALAGIEGNRPKVPSSASHPIREPCHETASVARGGARRRYPVRVAGRRGGGYHHPGGTAQSMTGQGAAAGTAAQGGVQGDVPPAES